MQKIKNIFNSFKFSTIKEKIGNMGYTITPMTILIYILVSAALAIFLGFILKLNLSSMLIIMFTFLCCTPTLITYNYMYGYQRQRFTDIVNYMERLSYSYQKTGKIYTALLDVKKVSSKPIQKCIDKAIEFIDTGKSEGNLYLEALHFIDDKYSCTRLKTLHKYLVDVETNGGDCRRSLELLTSDIRDWSIRTREYQSNRSNIRVKTLISTVLAILTCAMALYMVPNEYVSQMTPTTTYQVATVVVMLLYLALYMYVNKIIGSSYLDLEIDSKTVKDFDRVTGRLKGWDVKKQIKKAVITSVLAIIICIAVAIFTKPMFVTPVAFVFAVVVYQPFSTYKGSKKKQLNEIKKAFPIWIRNLILQLQVNNVAVSIQNSLEECPVVLRKEVEKLLEGIDKNPGSIEPFNNFCKDYDLPDIKMSVNFLYYLSEFGSDNMIEQLDYIIKQNNTLTVNEEKIRNSDSLAYLDTLILIPMVISIFKLMIDMYSLFGVFTTMFQSYTKL